LKIKSFGCSFLDGSDLAHPDLTWPARIAKKLGLEHKNHAEGASGNFRILHQILTNVVPDDFCFVNWTYTDRFCYRNWQDEMYKTLLPTGEDQLSLNFFKNIYGQYHSTFTSLIAIKTAIDFLKNSSIGFIMTYMDHSLMAPDNQWNHPSAVTGLQDSVRPFLYTWHGRNFLEWARINELVISDNNHPLDQAHEQAANFFGAHTEWLIENPTSFAAYWPVDLENLQSWLAWRPVHFEPPIGYK
jgi:hypothetical protein